MEATFIFKTWFSKMCFFVISSRLAVKLARNAKKSEKFLFLHTGILYALKRHTLTVGSNPLKSSQKNMFTQSIKAIKKSIIPSCHT
jgi:hypothetical protein